MTAAPATPTVHCEKCRLPFAVVGGPGLVVIAGVGVRTKRSVELVCPNCGHGNRWHGPAAVDVQDIEAHHIVPNPPLP